MDEQKMNILLHSYCMKVSVSVHVVYCSNTHVENHNFYNMFAFDVRFGMSKSLQDIFRRF